MDEKKIVVLPNGVRLLDNPPKILERAKRRLTILGRTSGPKGQRTEFLLQNVVPFLLEADPELEVQIAGGPLNNFSVETIAKIQSLKTTYRSRFIVRESLEMDEVNKVLATSTFVIGSGRVGMKALWQNTPLFAVGESLCHGWVTPANYQEVCASNFGDISARENQIEELSANRLLTMIREGLYSNAVSAEDSKLLQKYTLQRFGIRILNSSLNHEYRKVILKKRIPSWIPILMYHKLVESPLDSSHRIFLEKNKFEKHLASLKGRGYQTITFEQIEEFMAGNKSWDQFPKKPVMITFDDGYKEALHYAVPALQNHGYHGVFYVLGNPDLALNEWDMKEGEPAESLIDHSSLLKLSQAGHEIGAHSYSHPRLTDISLDEVSMEAQKSKEVLRD